MQTLRMLLEQRGPFAPVASMITVKNPFRTIVVLAMLLLTGAVAQAQISIREIEHDEFGSDGFTYTSGNFTPRAGSVLLAIVTNSSGTASNSNSSAAPTSATGAGLTWTQVSTTSYSGNSHRVTVFRAYTGSTVNNGTFTVNFPGTGTGQERRSCTIQVLELLGVEVTGTNAADAIAGIQTVVGNSNTATATVAGAIEVAGTGMLGIFANDEDDFDGDEEAGWTVLSSHHADNEDLSSTISYSLNTYDNSARMTDMNGNWAAIGIRLAPAEYFYNFPVVSTSAASNGQSYGLYVAGITSRSGTANNLSINMTTAATTFVAKNATFTFTNVGFNNGSTFVVDQNSTVNFPSSQLNSASNMFVANGGTSVINGDLTLNSGNMRIYGTVTVNGNLQMNSQGRLFIGSTGRLIVNGTFTMNGNGFTLVNGGQFTSRTMVTRSSSFIEMAQGATVETSVYDENNQANVMVMGPGAGCFGLYGPSGRINTQNNGFQPITNDATLKVCIPGSGVSVGNSFNSTNKGNANVTTGCTACSFLLGTSTLPITLNSFDGNMLGNGISQLVWSVANNDEVAGFTIEYSTDGTSFTAIGNIKKAAGSNYSFQHKSSHSGLIFYRLFMTDKMGKSTYSRTVSMLNGKQNSSRIIAVKPTMVSSNVRVELYAATGQQITYSIADAAGRILMTNKQAVQQGMSQVSVDVSRMPAGILYLQIQTQDGQRTVQKLMKQ